MHKFLDSVTLGGVRTTTDGYLVADAYTVRTGIQLYAGREVGKPDMPVVRVYRPESEVFHKDSVQSFSHAPVTVDHPSVPVTADNWKTYAVGEASDEVMRDGQRLRVPLIVKDAGAIKAIQSDKRELSAGYSCELSFEDGLTPDGEAYDAVQRNIRINHIAIVKNGRAGHEFRIGDGAVSWGVAPITQQDGNPPMQLRKIMVDGLSVETTEQGAEAIVKLQNDNKALNDQLTSTVSAHATQIAAKDAEIGELKVKLKQAEDAIPTGDTLDKMVADRAALVDAARKVMKDLKVEGLSDAQIRRAVVTARLGEAMTKDASDDEVRGMFKAVTTDGATGQPDQVRQTLQARDTTQTITDNGQEAHEARLRDAWKPAAQH